MTASGLLISWATPARARPASRSSPPRDLAFGKLLLDEGAVPPLGLRDVEGQRMVLGQHPDREVMEEWLAGFKTPAYPVTSLSDAEHKDPNKQKHLDALDKATSDGVANIRATPNPAASQ